MSNSLPPNLQPGSGWSPNVPSASVSSANGDYDPALNKQGAAQGWITPGTGQDFQSGMGWKDQDGNWHYAPTAAFGQNPQYGAIGAGANSYAGQMGAMGDAMLAQQAPNPNQNQFAGALAGDQSSIGAAQQSQQQTLAQLYAQSQGGGPHLAAQQMAAGTAQAQAQQQSLAHSQGIGGAGAMAARGAESTSAQLGIQNANATAQVNAQEQAAGAQAYQQLSNEIARQQQEQQQNAQGFAVGYGQLQGQQQSQAAQNQLAAYQQGLAAQQGQLTASTNLTEATLNNNTNQQLAQNAANQATNNQMIGAGTSAAGAMLAMSDVRAKRNVLDEGSLADRFLDYLHPYSFDYKDARDGVGRRLGVMAQNVEQAPEVGPSLVADTPRGKMLRGAPTMSALAAGVGRLHERLKALEESRSRGEDPDAAE